MWEATLTINSCLLLSEVETMNMNQPDVFYRSLSGAETNGNSSIVNCQLSIVNRQSPFARAACFLFLEMIVGIMVSMEAISRMMMSSLRLPKS